MRGLCLLAFAMLLCGCGVRGSEDGPASGRILSLEGLTLGLPAGWHGFTEDIGGYEPNPTIWAANAPLERNAPGVWPPWKLEQLPRDGVALVVSAGRDVTGRGPVLSSPVQLADGHFVPTGYEDQPAPHVSYTFIGGRFEGHLDRHALAAQVWFGANEPSDAMRAAADRVLASISISPEQMPETGPGWRRYRDEQARLTLAYPAGWKVAEKRLMPLLTEPHELVSLGTSDLRPGDKTCPQAPQEAVEALGPKDALISLLEHESEGRAPPRPRHLLPPRGSRSGPWCRQLERPAGFVLSSQSFADQGRLFQLYVAIGESATDQTRREAAEILDSLEFR